MSAYAGARGRRISRVSPMPSGGEDALPDRRAVRVSVVIPAKNEEANIAWVLRHLPLSVDEVILVDGNSTDRTVEVARAIRPDIIVIEEPGRGKGTAMRAGFATARGAYVVVLDADGSMDPADIDRFVGALEAGADLVKGSRYIEGGSSSDLTFVRSLGNRVLLFASNLIYGQRFTELCYGFMALRRSRIDELQLVATGFEIETEIVCRSVVQGLRITELPSTEAARISGVSNLHAVRDGLRIVGTIMRCAVSETVATATEPKPVGHLPHAFERFEELVADSHRVPVKAEISRVID
jgi:cellulose synthase/poly-beta-1,6-N-acetylglucosamine synthase-like glycosyltransferase